MAVRCLKRCKEEKILVCFLLEYALFGGCLELNEFVIVEKCHDSKD